jgi:predicted dehydrogenase
MDQPGGSPAVPRPKETFSVSAGKALYALEADDFAEAVINGRPPRITAIDTLGNMRVLDALRGMMGLAY